MNGSLVPANAKKSMLIAGFLRPMPDLLVVGVGISITVLILLILDSNSFILTLLACLPALISIALVLPIPNYHNTMTAIGVIYSFYTGRRKYVWKGWCYRDEFKE